MTHRERDIAEILETLDVTGWNGPAHTNMAGSAVTALEDGKVLYFPRLAFSLAPEEVRFLSPDAAQAGAKNISLDSTGAVLKHAAGTEEDRDAVKAMMQRYRLEAIGLMRLLLPQYANDLEMGRTSFRPAEISGRRLSAKKDDTRLHVDAFPSTPTGGKRILRLFTNVNPEGKGRDWRLGAPFDSAASEFAECIPRYSRSSATLMNAIGVTKSFRTAYDHMMLNLHDMMKGDEKYQAEVEQNAFSFPPGSSWLVYTDKVSHAARGGQHLFEQTFYLAVRAMADPSKSPLRILERLAGRALA